MTTTVTPKGRKPAPKFSDTAMLILSNAALRADRLLLPLPRSVKATPAVIEKTILQLKTKELIEELPANPKDEVWRKDENDRPLALVITQAGIEAVDGGFLAESILPTKRPARKQPRQAGKGGSSGKPSIESKPKAEPARIGKADASLKTQNNTKASQILALLKRANGATLAEMMKATGWQIHSVRGFLSGTVKKRLGLKLSIEEAEGKDRRYKIPAKA
ncbi:MAG: DUF3489 domain-containing protein [Pseudomonadota bacterium]